MPADHQAITIEKFYGLYDRGNSHSCPPDHSPELENVAFGHDSIVSRELFTLFASVNDTYRRAFIFNAEDNKVFIIAMDRRGAIYTQQISPLMEAPQLRIVLTLNHDMDMVSFNNRAYIVTSIKAGYIGDTFYTFDGTNWRVGGGTAPPTSATIFLYGDPLGHIEAGVHYFGVAFETITGFITPPTATNPTYLISNGKQAVHFDNVPIGPAGTVARRIVVTRTVSLPPGQTPYANGIELYETFFYQKIPDNTTTSWEVDFTDAELIANSSYLLDIYTSPPGGSSICVYHNRLVITAAKDASIDGVSGIAVSNVNDPETFSKVDGIIIADPSKNLNITCTNGEVLQTGLTDAQTYRDSLYAFRLNGTYGITDNGDVPSSWPIVSIDEAFGAFLHGVVTILDTGGINIEYIVVANKTGLYIFTGLFVEPSLTWKIDNVWRHIVSVPNSANITDVTKAAQSKMHFSNDSINKRLYCNVGFWTTEPFPIESYPNTILYLDYGETKTEEPAAFSKIKWSIWRFFAPVIVPFCGILYNDGTNVKFLVSNYVLGKQHWIEYGGDGTLVETSRPLPSFKTYLMNDKRGTFNHFGAIRYSAHGNHLDDTYVYSEISDEEALRVNRTLAPIKIGAFETIQREILINFISHLALVKVFGPWFDIRRIIIFVRPVYESIPR